MKERSCLDCGETWTVKANVARGKHSGIGRRGFSRSWTTANVPPLIHGGSSAFSAVSCWSATGCVAVGEGGGPNGSLFSDAALTGFWNGKDWKLVGAS
jgi:hypothetical protein